jgi:phosphoribosylaminoimidazolecarboxamide formyltransferase / IMP cyclohydrolase
LALKPLDKLPQTPLKINRALLSLSDKAGLVPFARSLVEHGIELISTGGTASTLREAGLNVTDVSEVTDFPECLDGRVKTLHPAIHGGILARTSHKPDLDELQKLDIDPIELVVVNLYPFRETIEQENVTPEIATENIDIGGPTMIRAAAKNFAHVCAVSSPGQYETIINELDKNNSIPFETRRKLAKEAFRHTADYDTAISHYFGIITGEDLPAHLNISLPLSGALRYGENPHQPAAVYGNQEQWYHCFHGKELSYNNYLDIDAALNLMADFIDDIPTAAIFKHTVPCGVASDPDSLLNAYRKAFSTDTKSPFGGIIIVNRQLDLEAAEAIDEIFTEIVLAPSFSDQALSLLQEKRNRRLIEIKNYPVNPSEIQFRSITGGALVQKADKDTIDPDSFKTVTERIPDKREFEDIHFAWKIVKHVKSNGIVYVKNRQTVGIGTGQTSRIDSSEIAISKSKKEGLNLEGSVIASDAFFPFPDGVSAAADAGATAVIQPGGSIRDQEVIDTANERNLAMIFTGNRHFKH